MNEIEDINVLSEDIPGEIENNKSKQEGRKKGGLVRNAAKRVLFPYIVVLILLLICCVFIFALIFTKVQQGDVFSMVGVAFRVKSCAGGELTQDCAKDLKSFMNDEMEKGYTSLPEKNESN